MFRKIFFSLCFILPLAQTLWAQTLYPIQKNGLWGAIDRSGKIRIAPTYDFMSDFNAKGLALVRQKNAYGLIDQNGNLLIPPVYAQINLLPCGLYAVQKNHKSALLDRKNNLRTKPIYDAIGPLNDRLLRTLEGKKMGVIDTNGLAILPPHYDRIDRFKKKQPYTIIYKNQKKGILAQNGDLWADAIFNDIEKQGATLVASQKRGQYKALFLDQDGKLLKQKDFPNRVAWQQYARAADFKKRKQILAENPSARKPRWVRTDYRFALQDGAGNNLLGSEKEFYNVFADSVSGLSMGKMDDADGKTRTALIDHRQAKILFEVAAKDLALIDYQSANYARLTIDTLWDAMINKDGKILRQAVGKDEKQFPITNVGDFYDGRAWFKSKDKYGFLDGEARAVILPDYEVVSDFSEKHAIGQKNGQFGAFDTDGKVVIPFNYEGIAPPQQGIFRAKKGKGSQGRWGTLNLKNKTIIPFVYEAIGDFVDGEATVVKDKKFGLIDRQGKIRIPPTIAVEKMLPFRNGIAWVGRGRKVQEAGGSFRIIYTKQGYVSRNGTFIIPPEYSYIDNFQDIWDKQRGICRVRKDGKVGYFDYKGNNVLPTLYFFADNFEKIWAENKGITKVSHNRLFGYVNHHGQEVVPVLFEEISDNFEQVWADSSGIALAKKEGKYGYLNYKAIAEVPFIYEALTEFREGIALAKKGGKWGVINPKNETVVPFTHEELRFLPNTKKAIIRLLKRSEKHYFIDKTGVFLAQKTDNEAQKPKYSFTENNKYNYQWQNEELGVAAVAHKDKQALAEANGSLLTKFSFRKIGAFSEGLAAAKKDGKKLKDRRFGYINPKGKWEIEPIYQKANPFSEGLAAVMLRQKWGYINKAGKSVIENRFRQADAFGGGYAVADGRKIIDKKGNLVGNFELAGKITSRFSSERAVVEETAGFYHIKPDGMPAYFSRHDAVTPFVGEVAFAKQGELWELTRRSGQMGNFRSKVRFSRAKRNEYLKKYGKNRKQELGAGNAMMDIGWEKIQNGVWKMIGKSGRALSKVVFKQVKPQENGFDVVLEQQYGLMDKSGKALSAPVYEYISAPKAGVVKAISGGKTGYFDVQKMRWIWKIEQSDAQD